MKQTFPEENEEKFNPIQIANMLQGILIAVMLYFTPAHSGEINPVLKPSPANFTPSYIAESRVYQASDSNVTFESKSTSRARWYAAGATFIPLIVGGILSPDPNHHDETMETISSLIVLTGILLGPGAGSIYADDWRRAGIGVAIRSGSLLVAGFGSLALLTGAFGGGDTMAATGIVLMAAGFGVLIGSAVYDIIVSSTRSVNDYNEALENRSRITLSPWVSPEGAGAGFQAQVRF